MSFFKIMLSYSHKDKALVEGLRKEILAHPSTLKERTEVWIDICNMHVGNNLSAEMHSAVRESDVVVLCLSKHYSKSQSCLFEARLAKALQKHIVPVVLHGTFPFNSSELSSIIDPGILRFHYNASSQSLQDLGNHVVNAFSHLFSQSSPPISIPVLRTVPVEKVKVGSPGENEAHEIIKRENLTTKDLRNMDKILQRSNPAIVNSLLPPGTSLGAKLALVRMASEAPPTPNHAKGLASSVHDSSRGKFSPG